MNFDVYEKLESNVRSYCRSFPVSFVTAKNATLVDDQGRSYIDFLAGAGALNYGHNPQIIKDEVIRCLMDDEIIHGLDMNTAAKAEFLKYFSQHILAPRSLPYRLQFTGPTGTNAVEAALKIARKVTSRTNIVSFMGGFHGMTQGSLAVTGAKYYREAAGMPLNGVTFVPYPSGPHGDFDSLGYLKRLVEDPSSGVETPAAVLIETIQGEGGVYMASNHFLTGLREFCDRHDILLIVDDIQAGCGRSGQFFSFEESGIVPDIVTMSKSISGIGLPMSIVLLKPHLDFWMPGQHNGTFRGNQLAFRAATQAIRQYWHSREFESDIKLRSHEIKLRLDSLAQAFPEISIRGRGLIWGIDFSSCEKAGVADEISSACFSEGLIVETCGRNGAVLKLLPPLNIHMHELSTALETLTGAIKSQLSTLQAVAV